MAAAVAACLYFLWPFWPNNQNSGRAETSRVDSWLQAGKAVHINEHTHTNTLIQHIIIKKRRLQRCDDYKIDKNNNLSTYAMLLLLAILNHWQFVVDDIDDCTKKNKTNTHKHTNLIERILLSTNWLLYQKLLLFPHIYVTKTVRAYAVNTQKAENVHVHQTDYKASKIQTYKKHH